MKKGIDKSSIVSLAGIAVSLFALIIIFSQNTIFSFLTTIIVRPFGFVGFWIFLPFLFIVGLYMLLKQKLIKFKVGLSLWGFLIIIFALLILTSVWGSKDLVSDSQLEFGTFSEKYVPALIELGDNPYDTHYGGGLAGYFVASLLCSAITAIGAQIVSWLLVVIGLCLVFHNQIKKLYYLAKGKKSPSKSDFEEESNVQEEEITNLSYEQLNARDTTPEIKPQPTPYVEPVNDLEIRNFNNTHSLKRATFSFSGDDDEETTMETPSFKQNGPLSAPSFAESDEPSFSEPSFIKEENEDLDTNEELPSDEYNQVQDQSSPLDVSKTSTPISDQDIYREPEPEVEEEPVVVDKLHRPQPKAHLIKNYIYPSIELLDYHEDPEDASKNEASTSEKIELINQIFEQLHIGASVVGSTVGPAVTRYDVRTNSDVSVNAVARYVEDISIRLGGVPVRFEKIVYGKATSGLEVPNAVRTTVGLRESIEKLPTGPKNLRYIPFGKNISGELLSGNLAEFPHMLVSGTTGSGKTIFMHSVILSLIMRNKPDELKIVLIDPKKVEMAYYEEIPHLLCPNISQSNKAYVAMKKLVDEMERRYNLFADNRVRDIKGFNELAKEKNIQPLPYIVVFIDEYADLVEEVKDIKIPVVRIAQKARAAGIHLVIATQRPSVNVIDGVIKANVSTRVALMVASQVDSISIIGQAGAETLLGNGDMIVDCALISKSMKPRVQGCFVDVPEINRVCDFLRSHYSPQYDPEFLDLEEHDDSPAVSDSPDVGVIDKDMAEEQLYELIKEQIVEREFCSISYIQRTYAVGFPKAGRLFNKLINDGYVARGGGDARGSKVLIRSKPEGQSEQMGTIEQSTFIPDDTSQN